MDLRAAKRIRESPKEICDSPSGSAIRQVDLRFAKGDLRFAKWFCKSLEDASIRWKALQFVEKIFTSTF